MSLVRATLALATLGAAFFALILTRAAGWVDWQSATLLLVIVLLSGWVFWFDKPNAAIFMVAAIGFSIMIWLTSTITEQAAIWMVFGGMAGFLFWGQLGVIFWKIASTIRAKFNPEEYNQGYLDALECHGPRELTGVDTSTHLRTTRAPFVACRRYGIYVDNYADDRRLCGDNICT